MFLFLYLYISIYLSIIRVYPPVVIMTLHLGHGVI